MSDPLPFTLKALEWYVFRLPCTYHYDRKLRRNIVQGDEAVTDWLREKAKGRWTWGSGSELTTRPYYIEDKQDAMLFKLTWCNDVVKPKFQRG